MGTRRTVVAVTTALALGLGGLLTAAAPASADAPGCFFEFRTSGNRQGVAVECDHAAKANEISIAWCDAGDLLVGASGRAV